MTRNLKALGLALLAISALGAVVAQGASAATVHKFHSDGVHTVITGEATEGNHKFAVGSAGTVECTGAKFRTTLTGTDTGGGTFSSNTMTSIPEYSGCTFGGNAATVNFNHCAYVFYGETTKGNPTSEVNEHANVEVECSAGSEIEVDTSLCTITIAPQVIKHAVRYENINESAFKVRSTAHKVKTGKKKTTESQTGCLLFPTGEIGTYTGTVTSKCFRDEAIITPENTEKTTFIPVEGETTKCTVSPGGKL